MITNNNGTISRLFRTRRPQKLVLIISLGYVVGLFIISVFADYFAPYNPNFVDLSAQLLPPSLTHLMGTDYLGRDLLSRIIHGARLSLGGSIFAIVLAFAFSTPVALFSAYIGGYLDRSLSTIMDTIYTFPLILIAIMVAFVVGKGFTNVALAIALAETPRFFRIIRSVVVSVKNRGFIESAKVANVPRQQIIVKHILPHVLPPLAVMAALSLSDAILGISILGFLSLGIPPPTPEWGADLSVNRQSVLVGGWWAITFPGIMILLSSLFFLFAGEMYNEISIKSVGE